MTDLLELLYASDTRRQELLEMANLWPDETGLSHIVWVFAQTGKEKHQAPRIKVQFKRGIFVPVIIADVPYIPEEVLRKIKFKIKSKDFLRIQEWILLNRKLLLRYWKSKGMLATRELLDHIQSLNE